MDGQDNEEDLNRWNVQSSGPKASPADSSPPSNEPEPQGTAEGSALKDELSLWGVDFPGVIDSSKKEEATAALPDPIAPEEAQDSEETETDITLLSPIEKGSLSENEIEIEVEGPSKEELWAVDEGAASPPSSGQALTPEMKESLRPFIEELVKEYCRKEVEKVAWEVIPDAAENLIKKAIKNITDSVP